MGFHAGGVVTVPFIARVTGTGLIALSCAVGGTQGQACGVVTVPFITGVTSTATIGVFDLTFGAHAGIVHQHLTIAAFGNGFAVSSAVFEFTIGTHAFAIDFQMVLCAQIAFAGVLFTVPHLFPRAVTAHVATGPDDCGPFGTADDDLPINDDASAIFRALIFG